MSELLQYVDQVVPEITQVWQTIHQNPELSMQEYNTCALLESKLKELEGIERIHRVGETGLWVEIVGTLPGDEDNVLMLRGDMDALPIQEEENGLPYRSQNDGVMHGCGHDVHCSSLLGSVKVLLNYRDRFSGRIWFFFQPGEEAAAGAKTFVEDPAIDLTKMRACGAVHVLGFTEVGKVCLKSGDHLACPDRLFFTVHGKSAHASTPSHTIDALGAAVDLVVMLRNLIARETDPTDNALLRISRFVAEPKNGSICETVEVGGSIATFNPKTRQRLLDSIQRVVDAVSLSTHAQIDFHYVNRVPALINDPGMTQMAARAVTKALGADAVEMADRPAMAAEDFALFTQYAPGVHMSIGCRNPGEPPVPAHCPQFYTHPGAIRVGITALAAYALEYFGVEY